MQREIEMNSTAVEGYIDCINSGRVGGWAADFRGRPPTLCLAIDGKVIRQFKPDTYRPDLRTRFGRNRLGFNIQLDCSFASQIEVTDSAGHHLNGSPTLYIEPERRRKTLALINRDMTILEIGPSFSPMAPKSEGWRVKTFDHATQEELIQKYNRDKNVDVTRIEPVDFVWHEGPIESSVPSQFHGTFDAAIASHVIEHIPDPVRFFQSIRTLLRPGGILSLVIPDKRFIFDFFRTLTSTGQWLDAFESHRTRHTNGTLFDHCANVVHLADKITWDSGSNGRFQIIPPGFAGTPRIFLPPGPENAPYVDAHAWTFTPSSFRLLLLDLQCLNLVPFRVGEHQGTSGCEFFVSLIAGEPTIPEAGEIDALRLLLMRQVLIESSEQIALLSRCS
jgi:SAM-dependent methyltransferase